VGAGECSGERGLDKWEDFMIISKLKLADDEWYNVEMLLLYAKCMQQLDWQVLYS